VPDGEAALARSKGSDYDLLLADVVMPGIDGIEWRGGSRRGSLGSRSCSSPALPR
jgi:DNA-binding response OmpR family regulator